MEKYSEKMYSFTFEVKGGGHPLQPVTESILWKENQGMGEGCHEASDVLLKGVAKDRKWHDDPVKQDVASERTVSPRATPALDRI